MSANSIYSKPIGFAILSAVVILIGTIVTTFVPIMLPSTQPTSEYVKPYSPIEIEGRDIYIREGCNNCHTQTVRPLRTEVARYGDYSKPEEFAYDSPHLWGSRRTGPDLAREGGKYPDSWHYAHMANPQKLYPASNMPAYTWLLNTRLDTSDTFKKATALGFGYSEEMVNTEIEKYRSNINNMMSEGGIMRKSLIPEHLMGELTEMDALLAYLQKLGRDLSKSKQAAANAEAEKNAAHAPAGATQSQSNTYEYTSPGAGGK